MGIKSKYVSKKIVLLLLLIIALVIGGVLLIDIVSRLVGVNVDIPIYNRFKERAVLKSVKRSENIYLLEREELDKKMDRIKLLEEIVVNRESEVVSKENELTKKMESVKERERELGIRTTMLDDRDRQFQDRTKNIREQASKLYQMPPKDAATILEQLKETDVVDILRAVDSYSEEIGAASTAPYLLKLINDMNKVKAADILSKLKYESGEKYTGVEFLDDPNVEVPPAP